MKASSKDSKKYKLAAVLPRYGESLGGGAETLVKDLLKSALAQGEFIESLEIWTTTAKDHRTWENELPEGQSIEDGVTVKRFLVDERDLDVFLKSEISISDKFQLSVEDQLNWLANGVNSTNLYKHIAENSGSVDYILFAPYLFPTSFWGSLIEPEKSILLPCLHDEPYAYQSVFQAAFSKAKGIIFNAKAEKALAEEVFYKLNIASKSEVVGLGFEGNFSKPIFPKINTTTQKLSGGKVLNNFILYSGRKEQGKNLDLLIDYFKTWKNSSSDIAKNTSLVIIGAGEINFLDSLPEDVFDLGFVSEEDKYQIFKEANLLCQPSVNESFSIVMMEAWSMGCPVLVHGNCPVTREHVVDSSGGLYFSDEREFSFTVEKILKDVELQKSLSFNGQKYVQTKYSNQAVLKRFKTALDKFSKEDSLNLRKIKVGESFA